MSENLPKTAQEDRTGLYEFGRLVGQTILEVRLLAYPLHVGAEWVMVDLPVRKITARVEGVDVLDLPSGRFPAWRIHITGDAPRNNVVWYGRAGYMGSKGHDDSGPPDLGRPGSVQIIYDHVESLTSLDLVKPTIHPHQPSSRDRGVTPVGPAGGARASDR